MIKRGPETSGGYVGPVRIGNDPWPHAKPDEVLRVEPAILPTAPIAPVTEVAPVKTVVSPRKEEGVPASRVSVPTEVQLATNQLVVAKINAEGSEDHRTAMGNLLKALGEPGALDGFLASQGKGK